MSKTAIEWLVEKISKHYAIHQLDDEINQAKEMEKQQIIDAYNEGYDAAAAHEFAYAEKYYNQTYGSNE